jgi:hypothetical protein
MNVVQSAALHILGARIVGGQRTNASGGELEMKLADADHRTYSDLEARSRCRVMAPSPAKSAWSTTASADDSFVSTRVPLLFKFRTLDSGFDVSRSK